MLVAAVGSWLAEVFLLLLSALLSERRMKSRSAILTYVTGILIAAYL